MKEKYSDFFEDLDGLILEATLQSVSEVLEIEATAEKEKEQQN